jgi:hypothetical protein
MFPKTDLLQLYDKKDGSRIQKYLNEGHLIQNMEMVGRVSNYRRFQFVLVSSVPDESKKAEEILQAQGHNMI